MIFNFSGSWHPSTGYFNKEIVSGAKIMIWSLFSIVSPLEDGKSAVSGVINATKALTSLFTGIVALKTWRIIINWIVTPSNLSLAVGVFPCHPWVYLRSIRPSASH